MNTDAPDSSLSQPDDPVLLKQINRELLAIVAKLQHTIASQQQQIDQLRRRLFGQKSEKCNPDQPLLFPELAVNAPPETPLPPPATPENTESTPKRRGHGRNELNPKLRRERREYVLSEEQRRCPCGGLCEKFGEEISEQLDYIPASLFVIEHVRAKYACPQCHDHVTVANKPEQPISKGLPGPGLLAQVITSKYADHIPLNRFENICQRQGVKLARSTMCDWMKSCADLLTPLYDMMVSLVLSSRWVHTDDTRVPCQDPEKPGKTISARMWAYLGDVNNPYNVFDFTMTWSRDGPRDFLTKKAVKFQGILQADALSGYDTICAELEIARAGCWAHARRYFHEARDSAPALAAEALARIGGLYGIEKEIKQTLAERQLVGDEAEALTLETRRLKSVLELTSLGQWFEQQRDVVLPKSPIGHAVQYALKHWEALLLYTQHGYLAIDNNAAERALRPIAVGRNNWLFVGSKTGGETAAVLFSFTSTCRRLNLDPFAYLRDVLSRLAGGPLAAEELTLLLPDRWQPQTNS